jgi:hypothetical protein
MDSKCEQHRIFEAHGGLHKRSGHSNCVAKSPDTMLTTSSIQFNALIKSANGNLYPSDWHGPPPSSMVLSDQAAAMSALALAISLSSTISSPTSTAAAVVPSTTKAPVVSPASASKTLPKGAIAGIAIAAVVLQGILVLGCFLFFRQRRARRARREESNDPPLYAQKSSATTSQTVSPVPSLKHTGYSPLYCFQSRTHSLTRPLRFNRRPVSSGSEEAKN